MLIHYQMHVYMIYLPLKCHLNCCIHRFFKQLEKVWCLFDLKRTQQLNGRVLDLGSKDRLFETLSRHCVEQDTLSSA